MHLPLFAQRAGPVRNVRLGGHGVADLKATDAPANGDHFAIHFMSEGLGRHKAALRPRRLPVIDMDVGAAHRAGANLQEQLIVAWLLYFRFCIVEPWRWPQFAHGHHGFPCHCVLVAARSFKVTAPARSSLNSLQSPFLLCSTSL